MKHSGAAVQDSYGGDWPGDCSVPSSGREGVTYLFFLRDFKGKAEVRNCAQPRRVRLLRTGQELAAGFSAGTLSVTVPGSARTELPDVVEIAW